MSPRRFVLALTALVVSASIGCSSSADEETSSSEGNLSSTCSRARVNASASLNVRDGAGTQFNRIGALADGEVVDIEEHKGGWARIEAPVAGWISEDYLDCVTAPAVPTAPANCTTVADGITSCSLANELMWVDKERSLVDSGGGCAYQASDLVGVDNRGRLGGGSSQIRSLVQPDLQALIADASAAAHETVGILSAFRSFSTQISAYTRWKNECESAYPGHSEHQLGTTVDLQVAGNDTFTCNTGFEATRAYQWLLDHAHEYGFTGSYPHCNGANYREETWHVRWVGRALAKQVHDAQVAAMASMPEVVARSISFHDWLECHAGELPFVYGRVTGDAGQTLVEREQFASVCSASAGTRYGKATERCDGYCSGKPACPSRDMRAICALFPAVQMTGAAGAPVDR